MMKRIVLFLSISVFTFLFCNDLSAYEKPDDVIILRVTEIRKGCFGTKSGIVVIKNDEVIEEIEMDHTKKFKGDILPRLATKIRSLKQKGYEVQQMSSTMEGAGQGCSKYATYLLTN